MKRLQDFPSDIVEKLTDMSHEDFRLLGIDAANARRDAEAAIFPLDAKKAIDSALGVMASEVTINVDGGRFVTACLDALVICLERAEGEGISSYEQSLALLAMYARDVSELQEKRQDEASARLQKAKRAA